MVAIPPALAQTTPEASTNVLIWLVVIVLAVVGVVIVALAIRRRVLGDEPDEHPGDPGFTLGDLRDLHAQGKLSDEEFEQAKRGMIARSRAMIEAPDDERPAVGEPGEDLSISPEDPSEPPAVDEDEDDSPETR